MNVRTTRTEKGKFILDDFGLYHYKYETNGPVEDAAEDALQNRPAGVVLFWFNGTFAFIKRKDTPTALVERWWGWRSLYQTDPKSLLKSLANTR